MINESEKISLVEIFTSIQGEGFYTGYAATFVRFAGCNMGCPWCDTDYGEKFEMSIDDIIKEVQKYETKMVVITGGEPTLQLEKLYSLARELKYRDYRVHLETNGSFKIDVNNFDWVTISPKLDVSQWVCSEVKVVNTGEYDLSYYEDNFKAKCFFLQPLSNDPKNIKECVAKVIANPKWHLSLQTHKLIGVK